ncbi:MAG: DUF4281 domain-containing protein [Cyclobacteriaceae bacterium]|nr:DUF4281 domain-containing protein [Cyclobacteriaceae bacterium]
MKPDTLFQICNAAAPLGWLLMAVAPRWKWTQKLVLSGLYPLLLGLVYLVIIVTTFGGSEGDFSSLAGVTALFQNPWALTAGWIHYLAFDMFIGAWEVSDSQKHGVAHWKVIPCLFLTFLFGPIGLISYFLLRYIHTRKFYFGERVV